MNAQTEKLIEIYTGPSCYFCDMAKKLFNKKSIRYVEISLANEPFKREEMLKRTNGKFTVPQIFINNKYIGGFEELHSLENSGKLNNLLQY